MQAGGTLPIYHYSFTIVQARKCDGGSIYSTTIMHLFVSPLACSVSNNGIMANLTQKNNFMRAGDAYQEVGDYLLKLTLCHTWQHLVNVLTLWIKIIF